MSSVTWPLFIIFFGWKLGFAITSKLFEASKLGAIHDPSRWYHWALFVVAYFLLESLGQIIINQFKPE